MKSLIEKLANGNVEYVIPKAKVSDEKLSITVAAGENSIIEFTVDSVNDKDIKGIVFSKDARIEVLNNQFFGKHNVIKLYVSAKHIKPETQINSEIVITSNAGEIIIPCEVYVESIELETSIGAVANLDDFMRLLAHDYEEALKLFLSKKFKSVLIAGDDYKNSLYDQLVRNLNREIAMEEFLVKTEMKKKVVLSLSKSQKEYNNITEAYGDVLSITRSCQGYVDIDVEIKGDFLHNSKIRITNDDFVGNTYEYPYLINSFKLHQGENRAKIILKTTTQTLNYDIIVRNTPDDVSEYISHKKDIHSIMKSYIDFRCGRIAGNKWITDMEKLSDEMLHKNSRDMIALLLKTQVSILSGDEDKSVNMLSRLSNMVNSTDPEKIEYYCYYLYLRTIHKKNSAFTDDVKREIKSYFENGYDKWGLLWMILYLDDRYTQNPSLKYTLIKEQFHKGCTSPVMYFEAVSVLNEQPALLRIMNPFELQVLNFGAKKGIISDKLVRQLMILLEKEKGYNAAILRMLMNIYRNNSGTEVLSGICRMLINGGRNGAEYLQWYEKGVEADLKLADLMENYVYAISNKGYKRLKPSVYMYFGYDTETLGNYQAYLYANIISNKKQLPQVYLQYKDMIGKYVLSQLLVGNINDDLVVIYKDILTEDFKLDEKLMQYIPVILNSYAITVANENVMEVAVSHKETTYVEQTTLVNGKAIITAYTENPIITFVDDKGRRLANIEYKMTKLLDIRHLKNVCEHADNAYVEINSMNKCISMPSKNKGKSGLITRVWNNTDITPCYRHNLSEFVIEYCTQNYDGGDLDDFLLKIDADTLSFDGRYKLVELLIRRGKYSQVASYIHKYGVHEIKLSLVLKFVTETIKNGNYQPDEKILELCRYLFLNGSYDAVTLGYLQKYYEGPTDEMYDMWKACLKLQIADMSFEERLMVQMLFEGRNDERMLEIFVAYSEYATGRNIRKAYYTYFCYHYFVKRQEETEAARKIFPLLEKDIKLGVKVSEICQMAYLGYVAQKEKISEEQISLCKNLIYNLTEINIVFEFYKKFNKWFKMPFSILDKTIIDYRTNPKNKVYIMYTVYDEEGKAGKLYTEEMSSVYPGIFVKQLTMFYGEKVVYTIVDKNMDDIAHSSERSIELTRKDIYNDENKFGQINGMLISDEIGRQDALDELMKNYEFNRQASEELFKLL